MKTARILTLLVAVVVMMGCAGAQFVKETKLSNGSIVVQGGRTGVFGTDNSFVQVMPPRAGQAQVVELKKSHTRSAISWTGCADRKKGADGYWKPNKRARNIKRSEHEENWTEDVVVGGEQAPTTFWAGGNTSTGNNAIPAAFMTAGMIGGAAVLRPSNTNINTQGGVGAGGAGGAGGLGVGIGGAGGSASSSSSSAAAAAASASSAAAAD